MHPKKQLTEEEFARLVPHLSKRANAKALHAVMVEGRTQAEVARDEGISRKAVSQSVGRAWQLHIERGDRPEGWVRVDVALPQVLADVVYEMVRKARADLRIKHGKTKNENAGNR